MDRHNASNHTAASLADRTACRSIDLARIEQCCKFIWIQIAAPLVYVYKLWPGSHLRDCFGGRQKGMGGRKDHVAPLDTCGEEGKAERISPAGYTNTIRCATKDSKVCLELLDHRPAAEHPVPQGRLENMQQLFLELLVWCHQINKWNHARVFHQSLSAISHNWTILPRFFSDLSAAASSWTIRRPASPSFTGFLLCKIQSIKCLASTLRASVYSTFGAHMSPER